MKAEAILDLAPIYNFTQWIVGAERPRRYCVERYGRPFNGARVIDVGCGPGLARRYLPDVQYTGFEPNARYARAAAARFGTKGDFRRGSFDATAARELAPYDLVLLLGVIHHCDDATAARLFSDIASGLAAGGRVVTLDPCFSDGQSQLARLVAARDRGRYVRTAAGYQALASPALVAREYEVRDGLLLIPTTVHIAAFTT